MGLRKGQNNGAHGVKGKSGRKPGTHTIERLKKYIMAGYFDTETTNQFSDHLPGDENEVRERFRILNEYFGWFEVIHSQVGFPDMLLRDGSGNLIRAELEVNSLHFLQHKHDSSQCDLIICWRHNWGNCPIPVMCIAPEWFNYRQLKQVKAKIIL